ncbi:MAG: hypothetical protein U9P44_04020, partial [archaeon]|nr:hypothetical protein [archaeon]
MIEYIFAVALGIGSVVIATIGLAELSGHEKKKEEIRVSADYIKKQGNIGEIKINDETYRYMTN